MLYVLATIAGEKDYASFLALPNNDFPNTFNGWLKLRLEQAEKQRALGFELQSIEVTADKFAAHCEGHGTTCKQHSLWAFAHDTFIAENKV
jgi:hypothetical protein